MKKTSTKPQGGKAPARKQPPAMADPLMAFADHLAAVLKIARESDAIPASFYNDLADAWNDFINELPSVGDFQESAAYIHLALVTRARLQKGGAR
jgi:hypothetical protein